MKTRGFEKDAVKGRPSYESAARPAPGGLAKVSPAGLAGTEPAGPAAAAESGEIPDESARRAKMRWIAGLYAALAALFLLLGEELYAMFLAACALGAALDGETRRRVPNLVMVCATVLVAALGILVIVLMILKVRGQ